MYTRIDVARHIVLSVSHGVDGLGAGCAMYSHLLRMNTKVTLFCATSPLDPTFAFLPWFAKVTARFPADADLLIRFGSSQSEVSGYEGESITIDHHTDGEALSITQLLYGWFIAHSIKINGKMANALYTGLLDGTRGFSDVRCTGATFAMAEALIGLGADHALCAEALVYTRSLAFLRMKSAMLGRMKLLLNGRVALFEVDESLLEHTGCDASGCEVIMDDALTLKTVNIALLILEDRYDTGKIFIHSDGKMTCDTLLYSYGGEGHARRAVAHIAPQTSHEMVKEILKKITEVIG